MKKDSPQIALFGIFGVGNFGNEASLAAMLTQLRQRCPEAELLCICTHPPAVARKHGIRALGIRTPELTVTHPLLRRMKRRLAGVAWRLGLLHAVRAARALWHTRKVDLLLFPGTGLLDDFATDPWMWPYDLLVWTAAAKLNGAKVVAVSIGAGPIRHPVSRRFMKLAARLCDYRSFRSENSRKFLTSLGIDTGSDKIFPDLAFSLALPREQVSRERDRERITVAVGIMAYFGWGNDHRAGHTVYERYVEAMAAFLLWLTQSGCAALLVIGEETDQEAVDDVLQILEQAEGRVLCDVVAGPMASQDELALILDRVDVVVAARFHNVVCALMQGKPTISLGYSNKNDLLMEEFGLGSFCQHIEKLDLDRLKQQFEELLRDEMVHRARIAAKAAEYRSLLDRQFEILEETACRSSVSRKASGKPRARVPQAKDLLARGDGTQPPAISTNRPAMKRR